MKCFTIEGTELVDGFESEVLNTRTGEYPAVRFAGRNLLYLSSNVINSMESEHSKIDNVEYKLTANGKHLLIPGENNDKAMVLIKSTGRNGVILSINKEEPCPNRNHLMREHTCPICWSNTLDRGKFPEIARKIPVVNQQEMRERGLNPSRIHLNNGEVTTYKTLVNKLENPKVKLLAESAGEIKNRRSSWITMSTLICMEKNSSIYIDWWNLVNFHWNGQGMIITKYNKDSVPKHSCMPGILV